MISIRSDGKPAMNDDDRVFGYLKPRFERAGSQRDLRFYTWIYIILMCVATFINIKTERSIAEQEHRR